MPDTIYHQLRRQLDQYSVGYPATESGVEIEILKKIFTEDEARLFCQLTLRLETPADIAARTGTQEAALAEQLETMARKGQLYRHRDGGQVRYAATPFVIGFYEFQVMNLDAELSELVERYFNEGFLTRGIGAGTVPLRTIPVNAALDASWQVAPYEDARSIVKSRDKIALAECICRRQQGLLDSGCDKPLEVCLVFGSHADFYVENGIAREIDMAKALEVLDLCEESGLVNQPANVINPGGMCNCCGDCCGILRALNLLDKPAQLVVTNYCAAVDEQACTGCEACLERCQMGAIAMAADGTAVVDRDRCIGCGLCVTTCPGQALQLERKPEGEQRMPPQTARDLMAETARSRGVSLLSQFRPAH